MKPRKTMIITNRANNTYRVLLVGLLMIGVSACKISQPSIREENKQLPSSYGTYQSSDSTNVASIQWRDFFKDPYLISLIDTALMNNQELNIIWQEIEISKNEVQARRGEYLPFLGLGAGSSVEKEGRYTRFGALEKNIEVKPGEEFPEPYSSHELGAYAHWELDVWKKLRNAKKSAVKRYLASQEGKNFMLTHLVAEMASAYYELIGLDNMLDIVTKNIEIQEDALHIIIQQKEAAKVSQLAINRFEAQLLNTKNLQYSILQERTQVENELNFLMGRFPKPIQRSNADFYAMHFDSLLAGLPPQLLENRPDIRQAELELAAAKLDVKVARAQFYPSIGLQAGLGFQAFKTSYLFLPESMLYNLAGDLVSPLINRNAIRATYNSANAKQLQLIYGYEQTILKAYIEVVNELARIDNYTQSFTTKSKEVDILTHSIAISNSLFRSARADYIEVLLTQREALESRMELTEIKMQQLKASVNLYRVLGGGWQ
ncbi:TolC family protein [Cytophagales bacterium LB-30]|uniref:TolC family protein n=1 Tax=Shiella aurantiaca TaxID=3058365 RepID=A0ABT8F1I9_9BACT|nr:TolC family protein [Shiella aurantiaca]MDN4163896.1 TolC family protein [Shiella aurantiaca]